LYFALLLAMLPIMCVYFQLSSIILLTRFQPYETFVVRGETQMTRDERKRERELDKVAKKLFGKELNDLTYDQTLLVEREYGRRIVEKLRAA
jgi:hypothetical protein